MRLLRRTISSYFLLSLAVLLLATPLLYFILKILVKEEVEEKLLFTKAEVIRSLNRHPDAINWQILDRNIRITPTNTRPLKDSFYTSETYDTLSREVIPQHHLRTGISVNGQSYELVVSNSLLDYENLVEGILIVQVVLCLLLLGGLLLINRNLSRRIWVPFYHTLDKLRTYRVEDHEPIVLSQSNITEFNDLNNAITRLAEKDRLAYVSQKEFAENASHEMQTPLAVFQSKLELLLQTSALDSEQAALIHVMEQASMRMSWLNRSLTLLAGIENHQFPDKQPVAIDEILMMIQDQYEDAILQKNIRLTIEKDAPQPVVMNKALADTLVSNLISNAIRHNIENGSIHIRFAAQQLEVANTGAPSPLNPLYLFQRFRKGNADGKGMGLGLEIVRKICTLYNFTVQYRFEHGLHVFTVTF